MIFLSRGSVRTVVLPELGFSLGYLQWYHPERGWTEVCQRMDLDAPRVESAALFLMGGTHCGRLLECDCGRFGRIAHPDGNALHAQLRHAELRVGGGGNDYVYANGILSSTEAMSLPSTLAVFAEVSLQDDGLSVCVGLENIGHSECPAALGTHIMLDPRAFGPEGSMSVRHDATMYYPTMPNVAVPKGTVEKLPPALVRRNGGPLLPGTDFCTTGLSRHGADVTWEEGKCGLSIDDEKGTSDHLHLWHGFCAAAELMTNVADFPRHEGKPGFKMSVLKPGGGAPESILGIEHRYKFFYNG